MRHKNNVKTLDREAGPRKALLRGLATNLVLHESITTTEAKAKAVKPFVEKLITKGKKGDLHARRELMKFLYTENAVKKVLEVLSPKYMERPGGYLRIVKLGFRKGDGAKVSQIEFV